MEDTCVDIISDISSWLDDYDAPNFMWIRGGPGMGKTTLAWTMVSHLERLQRCASFFLFRSMQYYPDDLWPTVANSMAQFHPTLKDTVRDIIGDSTFIENRDNVLEIFRTFIKSPLVAHSYTLCEQGIAPVFVIASLDLCNHRHREAQWNELLSTLTLWLELPKDCKLIFTSCFHDQIELTLAKLDIKRIDLLSSSSSAEDDIRTYISRRVSDFKSSYNAGLENSEDALGEWPSTDQLGKLIQHASGYFLWARAAMDFVEKAADPVRALETIVTKGRLFKLDDVDAVFDNLLFDAFDDSEDKPAGIRATLGALVLARRPLTVDELKKLVRSRSDPTTICARLSAGFTITDGHLALFHPSFGEYLTDSRRVGVRHEQYLVDSIRTHRNLVYSCLRIMIDELQFNICDVRSSYVDRADISDKHVTQCISSVLTYACKYWADHLRALHEGLDLETKSLLSTFFRTKLLLWIEAMALLSSVSDSATALHYVARCIKVRNASYAQPSICKLSFLIGRGFAACGSRR